MQSLPGMAPAAAYESSTLRPLMEAAFRYRRLWFISVVSLLLITILYALFSPRDYRSEMEILVQNRRGTDQITPERTYGATTVNDVTEEQINSEIEVLNSRGLANVVVDPSWNDHSPDQMTVNQLRQHDKELANYYKHLSVQMVRKSNVIEVTYTSSDPRVATEMLTRLQNAFLAKQRELGHSPGAARFFSAQAASYRSQLDAAQQKLAGFQQHEQFVSLQDTEQTLMHEIADAQVQLRATDAQISELSRQLTAQTYQLQRVSPRQPTLNRSLPNQYTVEQLDTMLAQLQNQKTSLLTKFTPQDRFVQEIDKKIADTQAALKSAEGMHSDERSTDVNPVWQQLSAGIVENQDNRQGLQARHTALAAQIAQLQGKLASIEGSTVAYTTLEQRVAELQSAWQLYSQKRDEAEMSDAMDLDRLLNVAVAQSPTFSIIPYRPKPLVDLVLGGFTAMFLSTFLVFFAEMGRTTVANPRELDRVARYPVLATVPMEIALDEAGAAERPRGSARLSVVFPRNPFRRGGDLNPAFERSRKEPQAS